MLKANDIIHFLNEVREGSRIELPVHVFLAMILPLAVVPLFLDFYLWFISFVHIPREKEKRSKTTKLTFEMVLGSNILHQNNKRSLIKNKNKNRI